MDSTGLPGEGPWQRFIVKFREDSGPGGDPRQAQEALERVAATLGRQGSSGVRLAWLRRLGIGADVFQADRRLERAETQRLMDALAARPDVEYVEPDAVMRAFTPPGGRAGPP